MIGIFFEKPNILYGTLCGFFYIALIAAVLIAIGLGSKLSIDDVLHKLFLDIALIDIFKLFLVLAAFTFGTWLEKLSRKVVKKSWRKSGKGQ